jgi:hypothetical protein
MEKSPTGVPVIPPALVPYMALITATLALLHGAVLDPRPWDVAKVSGLIIQLLMVMVGASPGMRQKPLPVTQDEVLKKLQGGYVNVKLMALMALALGMLLSFRAEAADSLPADAPVQTEPVKLGEAQLAKVDVVVIMNPGDVAPFAGFLMSNEAGARTAQRITKLENDAARHTLITVVVAVAATSLGVLGGYQLARFVAARR